jgi:hypothetical protein
LAQWENVPRASEPEAAEELEMFCAHVLSILAPPFERGLVVVALASASVACGNTVPVLELDPQPNEAATSPPRSDAAVGFRLRYEAETPTNLLTEGALPDPTCFGTNLTCSDGGVMEGANCCSGGGEVTELLGRVPCSGPPGSAGDYQSCQTIGGGIEFDGVAVPSDGIYDVTWWYHCGENNSYGDTACGGVQYNVGSSCRPHLIDVNGVPMSSTVQGQAAMIYQFPCYPGAWSILHGATTALPLRAGSNAVLIHAPHAVTLDGADIDAMDVQSPGQGAPPLVTPVVSGY